MLTPAEQREEEAPRRRPTSQLPFGAPYGNSSSYTPASDGRNAPFVPAADSYTPPSTPAE